MNTVSIIIPCRNEEMTIGNVLQALYIQHYPRNLMEVIICDGLSTDGTLEKVRLFQADHKDLEINVIPNPQQQIPGALNLAIKAAKGEIILRMDAHSLPREDYLALCVRDLMAGKGDNVGGRWEIIPRTNTWIARGISRAAAHPLGVGNARYRISGQAGAVDTVPFGCFYRSLFDRIGLFDESLLTNEDYELNTRIRMQGGVIWFNPEIVCQYYSQPTLPGLARQYWRYGFWKAKMAQKFPTSLKLRQLMPPLFVLGMFLLLLAGLFYHPILIGLLALFLAYLSIIIGASVPVAIKNRDPSLIISVPLAILTMHITWGTGFIISQFAD
jgi:succinoglycan biosynthesis protein ExoA